MESRCKRERKDSLFKKRRNNNYVTDKKIKIMPKKTNGFKDFLQHFVLCIFLSR